jgi:hypothetical protein
MHLISMRCLLQSRHFHHLSCAVLCCAVLSCCDVLHCCPQLTVPPPLSLTVSTSWGRDFHVFSFTSWSLMMS